MTPVPEELRAGLTVRQASAALGVPPRTLRRHLKAGTIHGAQLWHHSPWLIPASEVERVARLFFHTPDWQAALEAGTPEGKTDVADVTEVADTEPSTEAALSLES